MLRLIRKFSAGTLIPILWTLITIALLCIPGSDLPGAGIFGTIENFDKLIHIVLFGGIVLFWGTWSHLRNPEDKAWFKAVCSITLGVILLGIIMEYVQLYFIPRRDFDKGDISADIAGAIAAFGYLIIVRKK
ncbi:VanZ family protein [Flavitalea sp.]|nr:VanZ family protein [Flavitalea sp.]